MFHIFGLVHNKKSFPTVNILPAWYLCSFSRSCDCHATLYLNPEIQLSSYTLTRKHHLYVRALLNRSLRAHMTQKRLNNCMLLHVHKKVDNLNIIDIANEFGYANESRLSTFGKFSEHDFQTRSDNCN